MKTTLFSLLFISSLSYAACVGPYCYDDTGAYVTNLHVSSITYVGGGVQGSASSGGSPAGQNQQVQFNNNGVFGGSANFTWDGSTVVVNGNIRCASNSMNLSSIVNLVVGADNQLLLQADFDNTGLPEISMNPQHDITLDPANNNKIQFNVNNVVSSSAGVILIQSNGNAGMMDMQSTSQGLLIPRMTTTQRDLIPVAEGLQIYNLTTHQVQVSTAANSTSWVAL